MMVRFRYPEEILLQPFDVDSLIGLDDSQAPEAYAPPPSPSPASPSDPRLSGISPAAVLLGDAWPRTNRHQAQMALAGGLVRYMDDAAALEVLCGVCKVAGDEDRPKRRTSIREARARYNADKTFTGWPSLEGFVGGEVVAEARRLLRCEAQPRVDGTVLNSLGEEVQTAPAKSLFAFGGWDKAPPPVHYVVDGLITRGSVNMFVAHGDSMKTWALLSVLSSVSDGRAWLGKYPVQRGRVGILDYENGRGEIHRRLRILQADGSELGYAFGDISLTSEALWKTIAEAGLVALGVDSLAAGSWGVDENSTQAHIPLQFAKELGEKTGTATIFIHHARKGDGKGDKRQEVRGASALFAACDSVYSFSNEGGEGKARIYAIKTRQGKKPPPINAQLSDARGVTWYEDEARETARKAETVDDFVQAVLLQVVVAGGVVAGTRALAAVMQKRKDKVTEAVGLLLERGELRKVGNELHLDDPDKRRQRILQVLSQRHEYRTLGPIARLADVKVAEVEELEAKGEIAKYALGYGVVVKN